MGYDSFGLPAEQYAIQTGRPEDTTSVNIDGGGTKKKETKLQGTETVG
jgi:leucyl-tRNA synthetase